MSKTKLTGDWDKAKKLLGNNPGSRLAKAVQQATVKSAMLLVREIKKGIVSQAPGGQKFAELAPSTIARKGSSKALIDTGFLLSSITEKIMKDKAFVGLLKTAVNKKGDSIANIGEIMEFGCTIKMPNGATVVIPARPFLHPVMAKYKKQVIQNYRDAIKGVFHV